MIHCFSLSHMRNKLNIGFRKEEGQLCGLPVWHLCPVAWYKLQSHDSDDWTHFPPFRQGSTHGSAERNRENKQLHSCSWHWKPEDNGGQWCLLPPNHTLNDAEWQTAPPRNYFPFSGCFTDNITNVIHFIIQYFTWILPDKCLLTET